MFCKQNLMSSDTRPFLIDRHGPSLPLSTVWLTPTSKQALTQQPDRPDRPDRETTPVELWTEWTEWTKAVPTDRPYGKPSQERVKRALDTSVTCLNNMQQARLVPTVPAPSQHISPNLALAIGWGTGAVTSFDAVWDPGHLCALHFVSNLVIKVGLIPVQRTFLGLYDLTGSILKTLPVRSYPLFQWYVVGQSPPSWSYTSRIAPIIAPMATTRITEQVLSKGESAGVVVSPSSNFAVIAHLVPNHFPVRCSLPAACSR